MLPNGVTVTVQFGAVPATTIPETGMIAVFEDETVIPVVQLTVESISEIVKANAEVELSSLIVWLATVEINGASFTAVTVTLKTD